MILIDFSQIMHINIYPMKAEIIKDGLENTFNYLKHRILSKIISVSKLYPKETEIVLCIDKGSWRTRIHPHYKGRRKLNRKKDDFPWKELKKYMAEFEDEMQELFPFNIIKVDDTEGDDVIGIMTNYIYKTKPSEKIIIVSNDKDFKQLHYSNRIIQYDPKNKKEMSCLNYRNELMWLILKGDDADDVLNVKTTDLDTFINPNKKQMTMWKESVIWDHIHNGTVFDKLLVDVIDKKTKKVKITGEQLLDNFLRNQELVDLNKIPEDIVNKVIDTYEYNKSLMSGKSKLKLLKYFLKNKMRVMADTIEEYSRFYVLDKKENDGIMEFM